jgi:acyl-CoA thioesterase I
MKKKQLLILIALIVILAAYLGLSYWHIFSKVIKNNLKSPDENGVYVIGNTSAEKSINYVAMGDSLTAGVGIDNYAESYPYLLAEKLAGTAQKVIFYDVSHPGDKVADLKKDMLNSAISDNPDIVTILIGVNDIRNYTTENDFKKNYEEILKEISQRTSAKIYTISIPMIGEDILPPYNEYFNTQTEDMNKIIKELSDKYKAQYIDIYSPTSTEFKKSTEYYSADLFHPSAKGYAFWANLIYDNINR